MDYLPIQASAVPSKRVFSSSAETDTKKCNRINPVLMEALQMLKFALKRDRLPHVPLLQREIPQGIQCGDPGRMCTREISNNAIKQTPGRLRIASRPKHLRYLRGERQRLNVARAEQAIIRTKSRHH